LFCPKGLLIGNKRCDLSISFSPLLYFVEGFFYFVEGFLYFVDEGFYILLMKDFYIFCKWRIFIYLCMSFELYPLMYTWPCWSTASPRHPHMSYLYITWSSKLIQHNLPFCLNNNWSFLSLYNKLLLTSSVGSCIHKWI
jgi:hypothetical protein